MFADALRPNTIHLGERECSDPAAAPEDHRGGPEPRGRRRHCARTHGRARRRGPGGEAIGYGSTRAPSSSCSGRRRRPSTSSRSTPGSRSSTRSPRRSPGSTWSRCSSGGGRRPRSPPQSEDRGPHRRSRHRGPPLRRGPAPPTTAPRPATCGHFVVPGGRSGRSTVGSDGSPAIDAGFEGGNALSAGTTTRWWPRSSPTGSTRFEAAATAGCGGRSDRDGGSPGIVNNREPLLREVLRQPGVPGATGALHSGLPRRAGSADRASG